MGELKELAHRNRIRLEKEDWLGRVKSATTKGQIIDVLSESKFKEKDLVDLLGLSRLSKEELLYLMNTKQLRELAKKHKVPLETKSFLFGTEKITKKQDIISTLDSKLSPSRIRQYGQAISLVAKPKVKKVPKSTKKKKRGKKSVKITEEVEMEQEIVRTEQIKTRIRKTRTVEKEISRELEAFSPMVRGRFREKNLENQLVQWLKRPFEDVDYQVPCRSGKVDVVVDGKYAIELKIASAPSQLKSFLGQVFEYSREFEKVFLLIYDSSGSIKPSNIRP